LGNVGNVGEEKIPKKPPIFGVSVVKIKGAKRRVQGHDLYARG
jgi:hypothetical protein